MKIRWSMIAWSMLALLLSGCVTSDRIDYLPFHAHETTVPDRYEGLGISRELEERILALDCDLVSEEDVRGTLAQAPAPRIIQLHGGRWPVYKYMVSFAKFLEGMGYPEDRLRNPRDGTYSFSGYMSSRKLAGAVAWYYEREGLRPMMIGHSLGGFQTVRVLHQLAGNLDPDLTVWNPVTRLPEPRCTIVDPVTGEPRPVVDLSLSHAVSVGAGGLTRVLPNTWTLTGRLRDISDSTSSFTGYYIPLDHLGEEFLGFGSINHYHATGSATVRNVQLPTLYPHGTVPVSEHLLESREIVEWINAYQPSDKPRLNVKFQDNSAHILWAADAWHDIKKHWVLELQRVILVERELDHDR